MMEIAFLVKIVKIIMKSICKLFKIKKICQMMTSIMKKIKNINKKRSNPHSMK
jgi:hypothetical protein